MKKYVFILSFILWFICAPAYAQDSRVDIKNHAFMPATLTIAVGTKVIWTNHDEDPHTVSESGARKRFRSAALDTDDSYSYVFTEPGTYEYFCTLHPMMVGKVVVVTSQAK